MRSERRCRVQAHVHKVESSGVTDPLGSQERHICYLAACSCSITLTDTRMNKRVLQVYVRRVAADCS